MKPNEFRRIKDKPVRAYYVRKVSKSQNITLALVFDTHVLEIVGNKVNINVHKLIGQSGGATFAAR